MYALLLGLIQQLKRNKVDKVDGKELSTHDFNDEYKLKIDNFYSLKFTTEILIVNNDRIVLSNAPKDSMILNFNNIRYIDESNNVAYDFSIIPDLLDNERKTFILNDIESGILDSKYITVQYCYE